MNVLLVNDDGIEAKGLWTLYDAFVAKNYNVYMIAPKIEKSAMSQAITTREALRIEKKQENVWSVSGTPADCVLLAFEYILKNEDIKIDFVVSGINAGPNLASDVLYSGTVGAAIEAMNFGYKAIAISIDDIVSHKYETAAEALLYLIEKGILDYIDHHEIININVPNIDFGDIQGYTICSTGFSRYQDVVFKSNDGRNREVFWISGADSIVETSKYEIDTYVIQENKVAISPLKIDYNNYEKIKIMEKWKI